MEAQIRRAVRNAGYEPRLRRQAAARPDPSPWAGFGPVAIGLLLSMPAGAADARRPVRARLDAAGLAAVLLATPVQFWLGARFYRAGWHALRAGTGNMDLLVAHRHQRGYGLSLWLWLATASRATHAPVLRGLGGGDHAGAARQVAGGARQAPDHRGDPRAAGAAARHGARGARGGKAIVPLAEVLVGDRWWCGPASACRPTAAWSRAAATSTNRCSPASRCRWRRAGRRVTGGAVNGEGRWWRGTAVGAESVLSRIIRLVEDAQAAKAPIQRLVDQVSAVFVPVVLVIALLTLARLAAWPAPATGRGALIHAVAVLVIACPARWAWRRRRPSWPAPAWRRATAS
jgi:Cu+-exporting ATPase